MRPSRPFDLATRLAHPRNAFERWHRGPCSRARHSSRNDIGRRCRTAPSDTRFDPPLRAPARSA
ncbi:hypothetical protein WL88_28605 [Burkholderia diffusa]|uniref:Uncharacterized protein n=1 Tax=Burkholderia diffusa TaxID=488732 RepID=A0AAW3P7H2_9BURK|nr:hypothetical protein WI71_10260 [Burkholderia diffusa]KVH47484.1 hypothetical protein WJ39_14525 [Burkholderia diffusa]KVM93667.1 hypothetical protein WJ62_25390 [Burkholderia diffusa]KWF40835.1 hypothetical protein WL85_06405 [Burkholderia diffusa]KWF44758.1 hypothetical protein WL87_23155 [Burkholderia diffusa]